MRRTLALVTLASLVMLSATRAPGQDLAKVTVGTAGSQSDAPLFIGLAKGYFRDQGLDVTLVSFDAGANMVTPLGAGQLDVAGGNISAGLFNALERGIALKIVADKGSAPPGYGYASLLVRKALFDSGKVKSVADLRGLKIAEPARAATALEWALEKAGMTVRDVQEEPMSFPDHVLALANGSVDAALTAEPFATRAVTDGSAVRLMTTDVIAPNEMTAAIMYGGPFMQNRPEVARKFMVAYLKSVRYYNDALKGGKIAGPNAADVIAILTKYTRIKDPAVYRTITPNGVDPNGHVNVESLSRDLRFYRELGLVKGDITVEKAIDTSYAEGAVKLLGPYRKKTE